METPDTCANRLNRCKHAQRFNFLIGAEDRAHGMGAYPEFHVCDYVGTEHFGHVLKTASHPSCGHFKAKD